MTNQPILSKKAPQPIGPFVHAVKNNDFLFISGQGPIVPKTNQIIANDIRKQAFQCLKNLEAILLSAKYRIKDIVKITIFFINIDDYQKIKFILAKYFSLSLPACTYFQVARLPGDIKIEMQAIAYTQNI